MSIILIARHGNTFEANETPVRIGFKTDLPLSSSGKLQAKNLGLYLKQKHLHPTKVYVSNLQRTQQTAQIALEAAGIDLKPIEKAIFNEIDYGIDEGKTNAEVIARIGKDALNAWENAAIVPQGWIVSPQQIINAWQDFASQIPPEQTVLVVTSNGIARFAPYLTSNFARFSEQHKIKLATGAIGALTKKGQLWDVDFWNETPQG